MNKKGEITFASVVATIGSILIACGFAWLLATNWRHIPDFLKIIILVGLTAAAYTVGVLLKERNYEKTGQAIIILGALLYSLSVFLISQIFDLCSFSAGQCYANLVLIIWVGVIISAYVFKSYTTLLIGLAQFLLWGTIQVAQLAQNSRFINGAVIAFYLISTGIIFYALSLFHRLYKHKFARLYQWWTAFYFLSLGYIISFQVLIPFIWETSSKSISFSSSVIITLIALAAIAIISLIGSIITSANKKIVSNKEIIGVFLTIIILIGLVCLTGLATNTMGVCYEKQCYNYETRSQCVKIDNCEWRGSDVESGDLETEGSSRVSLIEARCYEKSCHRLEDKESCEAEYDSMGCEWKNHTDYRYETQTDDDGNQIEVRIPTTKFRCEKINCYELDTRTKCRNVPDKLNCRWENNRCDHNYLRGETTGCRKYDNKQNSCEARSECKWRSRFQYSGKNAPMAVWIIWIIINIAFIGLILAVIGYGIIEKFPAIINLGIIAFSINIITRYIGFIMDLWGYTTMSIIFITGGIILLVVGWFIEKWRKKLVKEAESGENQINTK